MATIHAPPDWEGDWEETDWLCPECGEEAIWEDSEGNRRCASCENLVEAGDWLDE